MTNNITTNRSIGKKEFNKLKRYVQIFIVTAMPIEAQAVNDKLAPLCDGITPFYNNYHFGFFGQFLVVHHHIGQANLRAATAITSMLTEFGLSNTSSNSRNSKNFYVFMPGIACGLKRSKDDTTLIPTSELNKYLDPNAPDPYQLPDPIKHQLRQTLNTSTNTSQNTSDDKIILPHFLTPESSHSSSNQFIGDILLATSIQQHGYSAIKPNTTEDRGQKYSSSFTRFNLILEHSKLWCQSPDASLGSRQCQVHTGTILSGDLLLNNFTRRQQLTSQYNDAIGLEMEGAGLGASIRHFSDQEPFGKAFFIFAKSICDWGVGKSDLHQLQSAKASVSLLLHSLNDPHFFSDIITPTDKLTISTFFSPPPSKKNSNSSWLKETNKDMVGIIKKTNTFNLERKKLLESFQNFALSGHGIVVGQPGIGKTYILLKLQKQLDILNIPNLYLPIDQLGDGSEEDLKSALNYKKQDLITYLQNLLPLNNSQKGILIFDAYDAARNQSVQQKFLQLIRQAVRKLSNRWNVIVSVRIYDAKKSQDLLDLFPPSLLTDNPTNYRHSEISCRHFMVPNLEKDEVTIALNSINNAMLIYQNGSQEFKNLLFIPFYIWLLEQVLQQSTDPSTFSHIRSEVQFLALYWNNRIKTRKNKDEREVFLTKALRLMIKDLSLSIRKEHVYDPRFKETWEQLFGDEILIQKTSGQKISFSHNILFDYAVSVLLIEDEADKLISFVTEDISRSIFLRPSLLYYFARLWYDQPEIFWNIYWSILDVPTTQLTILTRLIPPNIIVSESHRLNDLQPLLDVLKQNTAFAANAILQVLQALVALEIKRDKLWLDFLYETTYHIKREFLWDLGSLISTILRRNNNDNEIIELCGSTARKLLTWVWQQRENKKDSWLDDLAANFAVPVICSTFGTNQIESKELLTKILSLITEDDFPIRYFRQLTRYLNKIWCFDPILAASTYIVIFGYNETSEEITHMGGIVTKFSSTRRQDYNGCKYDLLQKFPYFLKASPNIAAYAIICCTNNYITNKRVIPNLKDGTTISDLTQTFQFHGQQVNFIPDSSYIWDRSTHEYEPIEMATHLFGYLIDLANQSQYAELNQILLLIYKYGEMAFFWRRLLTTGAKLPKLFAPKLFELCLAHPILTNCETVRELGIFLEASAREFTEEQLLQIEVAITELPNTANPENLKKLYQRFRDRLLARIPYNLLKNDQAKSIYEIMQAEKRLPANEPFCSVTVGSFGFPIPVNNETLLPENQETIQLKKHFEQMDAFAAQWKVDQWNWNIPTLESINTIMPLLKNHYSILNEITNVNDDNLNLAWIKFSFCIDLVSRSDIKAEEQTFSFCKESLIACARYKDPKLETNLPNIFWEWPGSPRISAARGLIYLATKTNDEDILNELKSLAHDSLCSVRSILASQLVRLVSIHPTFFWSLLNDIASTETELQVQNSLLRSLWCAGETNLDLIIDVLGQYDSESIFSELKNNDTEKKNFLAEFISHIVAILLTKNRPFSSQKINQILQSPIRHLPALIDLSRRLRIYITPKNLMLPENKKSSLSAIEWLAKAITSAYVGIQEMNNDENKQDVENRQKTIQDLYSIIDNTIMHFFREANIPLDQSYTLPHDEREPVSEEERQNFYLHIKPILKQILNFAQDKKFGILASTAHQFMQLLNGMLKYDPKDILEMALSVTKASQPYQYNFDPMSIDEFVKLTEAILANHRSQTRDPQSINNLLQLLDIFAQAGWAKAYRLVWRLEDIFR